VLRLWRCVPSSFRYDINPSFCDPSRDHGIDLFIGPKFPELGIGAEDLHGADKAFMRHHYPLYIRSVRIPHDGIGRAIRHFSLRVNVPYIGVSMDGISIEEGEIDAPAFNRLRKSIELALGNTLLLVLAKDPEGEVVGMARIIGKNLMERVMEYIARNRKKALFVGLTAAKGKEGFYRALGLVDRPAENYGPGMC
jgi:hypothetical protein